MQTNFVSTTGRNIHKLIVILAHIMLFITPLIFIQGVNELFEFPKMIFVYVIASSLTFLAATLRVLKADKIPKSINLTSFDKVILLVFFINLVSTIFSEYTYTSLWGYYTRFNGGLVSISLYTALYFIISYEFTQKEKSNLIETVIASSFLVCLYAIAQHFGYEKDVWEVDSQARVFASLGQPNWLAAYLIMTILPSFYKFFYQTKTQANLYTYYYATFVLLNFSALWFTYSLSGLLGLIFGLVFFVIKVNKNEFKAQAKKLSILIALIVIIAVTNLGIIKPKIQDSLKDVWQIISQATTRIAYASEEIQNIHKFNRFGDTTAIRLYVWQGTLNSLTESPKKLLIGSGPETFAYEFRKFRPAELNYTTEWDFIFNKPHNYYLELLSNLGFIGLTGYLILNYVSLTHKASNKAQQSLQASLLGFYISNLFGWPTVMTTLLLYIYISLLNEGAKNE